MGEGPPKVGQGKPQLKGYQGPFFSIPFYSATYFVWGKLKPNLSCTA